MSDAETLADVLGCRFNEWNECAIHYAESQPWGYDEPYCPIVESILDSDWLAAERAEAAGEALREAADDYMNGGIVPEAQHRRYVYGWLNQRATHRANLRSTHPEETR